MGSVGAWSDDLCRLIAGERRRFDGGVEAVMEISVGVVSSDFFVVLMRGCGCW